MKSLSYVNRFLPDKITQQFAVTSETSTTSNSRLYIRQLAMSSYSNNRESAFHIGNAFFTGFGVGKSCEASIWWYSKASNQGSTMSSLYLGTMYHFGICNDRNIARAIRYYHAALIHNKSGDNDIFVENFIWLLQLSTKLWRYSYTIPIAKLIEYSVKLYFEDMIS